MYEYSKQFPISKKQSKPKPTTGNLLYDGKVVMENRPFATLQAEKKRLLTTGYYRKELFKITYWYGNNR